MAYGKLNYKEVGKEEGPYHSREAIGNSTASTSSSIDVRGRSLEPPVDRPLEPLKHQTSI